MARNGSAEVGGTRARKLSRVRKLRFGHVIVVWLVALVVGPLFYFYRGAVVASLPYVGIALGIAAGVAAVAFAIFIALRIARGIERIARAIEGQEVEQ